MVIAQKYQHPPAALASYDWTDLAAGVGIINYYASVGKDNVGFTYHLNTQQYDSWLIETNVASTTTILTFDSGEFNIPSRVKGTAYFSCHMGQVGPTTYLTAQFKKLVGGTPVNLTAIHTSGSMSATPEEKGVYLEMPITTETVVKVGEQLRLVVTIVATGTSRIGHSPTDQTSPTAHISKTVMVLGVPFQLDL